jgi:hypothetical protein
MLHLPQIVYDVAGVASFSIGRGVWIDRKAKRPFVAERTRAAVSHNEGKEWNAEMDRVYKRFPLAYLTERLWSLIPGRDRTFGYSVGLAIPIARSMGTDRFLRHRFWLYREAVTDSIVRSMSGVIVYGGLVAIVIAALFGIDFVYRHFAQLSNRALADSSRRLSPLMPNMWKPVEQFR